MVLVKNGWSLRYHRVFGDHYNELRARVRRLRETLPRDEFIHHPEAKLLAAVKRAIEDTVPAEPNRPDFWLKGDLSEFRRVKGYGLPDRYRLFYVFSQKARSIIYLYLNDSGTLRKEGSKTDPYEVFSDLVSSGRIGKDFDTNLKQWQKAQAAAVAAKTKAGPRRETPRP